MNELLEYVRSSTVVYRKGDVVKAAAGVVTVDAFPERPETRLVVDCHFVTVGFTEHAPTLTHEEFYQLVVDSERGEFCDMSPDRLREGPSYIEVGGWLGDQTLAFQFMALGQLHGFWHVVTPALLGVEGLDAARMAGSGLVLISGLQPPARVVVSR